jgi:hypothetical protein
MVGSAIGRSLAALPGLLASVAAGMIIAGLTRELTLSLAVVALLVGIVLLRVTAIGVTIDLDRERIVVRTFWRKVQLSVDDLDRVDARLAGDGWPPGVRFVTRDGREYGSVALCYLDEERAGRFIAQLEALAGPAARVTLEPSSFRPSPS